MNITRSYSAIAVRSVHQTHVASVLPFRKYEVPELEYKPTVPLACQQFVPNDGDESYLDETRPPMLMLHGLFGSKRDFQMAGKTLAKNTGFPMYGIDLRNHGSSPHASEHTYSSLANDVIRLLKEREWEGEEKPILCGHSMGAKTAMLVALLQPDLISKLIIIDNAPVSQPLDKQYHQDLLGLCHVETNYHQLINMKPKHRHGCINKILQQYEVDKNVCDFLKSNVTTVKKNHIPPTMVRMPVFNFKQDNVLANLGDWPQEVANLKFEKPTLILKADGSNFIHSQDQFTANFPQNIYEHYYCSHWLVSDLPNKFIADVTRFITSGYIQEV